jgi:hypothetical protein
MLFAAVLVHQHWNDQRYVLDAEQRTLQLRPHRNIQMVLPTATIEHLVFSSGQCLITLHQDTIVLTDHENSGSDQQRIIDFLRTQQITRQRSKCPAG